MPYSPTLWRSLPLPQHSPDSVTLKVWSGKPGVGLTQWAQALWVPQQPGGGGGEDGTDSLCRSCPCKKRTNRGTERHWVTADFMSCADVAPSVSSLGPLPPCPTSHFLPPSPSLLPAPTDRRRERRGADAQHACRQPGYLAPLQLSRKHTEPPPGGLG